MNWFCVYLLQIARHFNNITFCLFQPDESIFEFLVDNTGQWAHWSTKVEDFVYPSDSVPEFATILVPNVDNIRTNFLIGCISKQKKAVLLIGTSLLGFIYHFGLYSYQKLTL